jgi:hypothetical protein
LSNYSSTTSSMTRLAQQALIEAMNTRALIAQVRKGSGDYEEPQFSYDVTRPPIQPPPNFSDLFEVGDGATEEVSRLNNEAKEWLEQYFPAINGGLKTLPEDMLVGIISGVKPFGLDQTIFEVVWHRARDRAYRTQATETKSIAATFSGAGFALPPGAMLAAIVDSEARGSMAIAEVSREQAIKDADIKLDLLKFAEEQAIRLKLGVMQSMADFYRMWHSVPDRDIERSRVRSQAMGTFYNALSSYYGVETSFARLDLEASKAKSDVSVESARLSLESSRLEQQGSSALGQVATAFGNIASGAASAASTLVAEVESV